MPVYSRAGLSRTVTLVIALSLTAVSAGDVARGVADTGSVIDLDRSNGATIGSEIPVSLGPWRLAGPAFDDSGTSPFVGVRFEAATAGIHAQAQPDAAPARLIERIRKVE